MSADDGYEHIIYEVKDGVAIITMNHPERLNSLDRLLKLDIARAMQRADVDDDVRCIVWTGNGRAFSSGGDSSNDPAGPGGVTDPWSASIWEWYLFLEGPHGRDTKFGGRSVHKPLIAAVNGLAFGAAVIQLTECDIVIASERATFCMIEARSGQAAASNLPFVVGPQWAKVLVLTGEEISARRAEKIGLVVAVVPHEQLMERALDMARRVAAMPRYAVMLNKAQIDGIMDMMGWAANERFSRSHGTLVQGMSAFAESADGRRFRDVMEREGFRGYIRARDAAFKEPWFKDE